MKIITSRGGICFVVAGGSENAGAPCTCAQCVPFSAVLAIGSMYRLSNATRDFDDVYLTELFPEVRRKTNIGVVMSCECSTSSLHRKCRVRALTLSSWNHGELFGIEAVYPSTIKKPEEIVSSFIHKIVIITIACLIMSDKIITLKNNLL